jgi:polysaccharide biosynthesis/export protein
MSSFGWLAYRAIPATLIMFGCLCLSGCAPQGAAPNSAPVVAAVAPAQPVAEDGVAPAGTAVQSRQLQPAGPGVSGNASNGLTQPTAPAAQSPASASDYRVMSGDVLQITVFQIQDMSREAQVDAAGNIVLPLIGAVPVAGKTLREAESEIARRLKAKYLQDPQVLVAVKDAVGLRVAVQGAVRSPAVVQIRGDTTLTNLIAQTGGFTETADKSSVLIIRNTDQGRTAAKVDAGAILAGSAPDPRVYGGDTVVVDDSLVRMAGKDALSLLGGAAALRFLFP